jgi:hypothetical protein
MSLALIAFFYSMTGIAGGSQFTALLSPTGLGSVEVAAELIFNVFSASSSLLIWKAHIANEFFHILSR